MRTLNRSRHCRRFSRLILEELETRTLLSASALASMVATPLVSILNPQAGVTATPQSSFGTPPSSALTPGQVSNAYGFNQISFGSVKGDGSGQTIAIVDAYNDPTIKSDLTKFDNQFGIAAPSSFSVVNQTGGTTLPSTDPTGGWALETALDVEWAHAMAPGANILLVEANSGNMTDLLTAVQYAAQHASVVSMSWGTNEFAAETGNDATFTQPGVTYVAAAGDTGAPPMYPAVSPNVLSVGGTSLTLDNNGAYSSEKAWGSGGGGISQYETLPGYQPGTYSNGTTTGTSTMRMSPDVSYNANPNTGYAVYDSTPYYQYYPFPYYAQSGWFQVGGTSAGAPQWSALVAIADQGRALNGSGPLSGAGQTLPAIYNMAASNFHDVTSGTSSGHPHYTAGSGYDLVTGRGSPIANLVVSALVSANSTGGITTGSTTTPSSTSPRGSSAPSVPLILILDIVESGGLAPSSFLGAQNSQLSSAGVSSQALGLGIAVNTAQTPFGTNSLLLTPGTLTTLSSGPVFVPLAGNAISPSPAFSISSFLTPNANLGNAPAMSLFGMDRTIGLTEQTAPPPLLTPDLSGNDTGANLPGGEANTAPELPACDACFAEETTLGLLTDENSGEDGDENWSAMRGSGLALMGLFVSGLWLQPARTGETKGRRMNLEMAQEA